MIPGVTAIGEVAISELPFAYSQAHPNPLTAVLANPAAELIYALKADALPAERQWLRFTHDGGIGTVTSGFLAPLTDGSYSVSVRFRLNKIVPGTWQMLGPRASAAFSPTAPVTFRVAPGTTRLEWAHGDALVIPMGELELGRWYVATVSAVKIEEELFRIHAYVGGAPAGGESGWGLDLSLGFVAWGSQEPPGPGPSEAPSYVDVARTRVWRAALSPAEALADALGEEVLPGELIHASDWSDGAGPFVSCTVGPPMTRSLQGTEWGADTAEGETIYLASRDYRTGAEDTPAHTQFPARLSVPYSAESSILENGTPTAGGSASLGVVEIVNTDGACDNLAASSWYGRRLEIKVGTRAIPYQEWATVFRGAAEGLSWDYDRLTLALRAPSAGLAIPAQAARYDGRGACLRFDGVDDYATGSLAAGFLGSRTFEAWVRPLGLPSPVAIAGMLVATGGSTNAGALYCFLFYNGQFGARLVKSGLDPGVSAGGGQAVLGRWHHVAVVYDETAGSLVVYQDGLPIAAIEVPFQPVTGPTAVNLGRNVAGAQFFEGEIDEVRLWTRARTAAEIRGDMHRRLTGVEADLAQYWRVDEGTGSTLANAVTGGASLSVSGAIWVGTNEGLESVAGRPKPLVYGRVNHVEPVLLDPAKLVYQVHDGPIQSVLGVYDQGVGLTAAGDSGDIYATAPDPGKYRTDRSRGLLRLGSVPVGPLTVSLEGDASEGGYSAAVGEILRRLALRAGLTPEQLDEGSFAALSAARPGVIGYVVAESATAEQAISEIADSVGAYWTYTRGGLLSVGVVEGPGTAVAEITEADIVLGTLERLPAPTPVQRWRIAYGRVHRPHAANEIAGSVYSGAPSTWLYLQSEWRWTVAEAPGLGAEAPTADEVLVHSCYAYEADARAEAERRLALYSAPRDVFSMGLTKYRHQLDIGQTVTLRLSRYGLTAGKQMVVVGWAEDATSGEMRVTLWG